MAGEQLELMKPAVMAPTKRGFYAGSAAYADRGYVVIVVADATRVMTIRFLPPNCGTAELLQQMADYIKAAVPSHSWGPASTALVAREALKQYGGKPGEKGPEIDIG
jgi:hypothetical protein